MSLSLKSVKVGDEITLVHTGLIQSRHGGTQYTDHTQIGHTCFFKVTKKGTKHLTGHFIYFDDDKKIVSANITTININSDFLLIFSGLRTEFKDRHRQYLKALLDHVKKEDEAYIKIDRKYRDLQQTEHYRWCKQNPYPRLLNPKKYT